MTRDQALAIAAAELDVQIARAHARFEQSLITNRAPDDQLDLLLEYEADYMQAWRARTLDAIRARLLPLDDDDRGRVRVH
jgi:hypothetical protein